MLKLAAVAALVLTGCAGSGRTSGLQAEEPVRSSSVYRIGPGDTLQVFVWQNPEVSVTVPVRPDGKISTPLVDDMIAVGKTPSELADDITVVLSTYIRAPEVNIIVSGFVGTFDNQIRVVGQATSPRALSYRERMTVLDVMIEVGGLTALASGNRAKIVRTVNGEQREMSVRLRDLLNKGDMSANVAMEPGDVLIIPESRF